MDAVSGGPLALPADITAVAIARRHVAEQLSGEPRELVSDVQLVASEMVTNASVYGRGAAWISVDRERGAGVVRVSVADHVARPPLFLVRAPDDALRVRIVFGLADRWGAEYGDDGNVVWCEFDRPA
jgi:anti-sigma regulatory factor (Ser/Thr protein kinase)